MCRKYFQKWYNALTKPKETFKKEKKNASLKEAIKNIGLGGLIGGVAAFISLTLTTSSPFFALSYIISVPIASIISLIISSAVFYLFAKLFGGKGNYNLQTYLISLYRAPLLPIVNLFAVIPLGGIIIRIAAEIYAIYLTTLALKETHNYSTGRAVATWLVPALIVTVFVAATYYIYIQTLNQLLLSPITPEGSLILPPP